MPFIAQHGLEAIDDAPAAAHAFTGYDDAGRAVWARGLTMRALVL